MDIYYSLFTFPWAIVYVLTLVFGIFFKFSKDRKEFFKIINKSNEFKNDENSLFILSKLSNDYIKTHKFSYFKDFFRLSLLIYSFAENIKEIDRYKLIKENYFWGPIPQENNDILFLCIILSIEGKPEEYNLFLKRLENNRKMRKTYRQFRRLTDTNNLDGILSDEYTFYFVRYVQCFFAEYAAKKKGLENSEEFLKKAEALSAQNERLASYKDGIISMVERFDKENE